MARYIDADKLYSKRKTIEMPDPNGGEYRIEVVSAYEIKNAPTVDVAETVVHTQAHYEAIYALADMVVQFGYSTKFRNQNAVCDGGLSALEYAFGALEDCGCKVNSNGTITLKNLFAFQEEIMKKIKGE